MKILYADTLPNYLSKFHKYGSYNFFFQADVHIWLTTSPLPPVRICPLLPGPFPPTNVRTSFVDGPF